jgi:hypothetical protein
MFEGWTTRVLKGERGVRAGKYLLLFEIVDPEARDRYFPAENQGSDEVDRFDEQNRQAADAWDRLHALRPIATQRPTTSWSPSNAAAASRSVLD